MANFEVDRLTFTREVRSKLDAMEHTAGSQNKLKLFCDILAYLVKNKHITTHPSFPKFSEVVENKILEIYYGPKIIELINNNPALNDERNKIKQAYFDLFGQQLY